MSYWYSTVPPTCHGTLPPPFSGELKASVLHLVFQMRAKTVASHAAITTHLHLIIHSSKLNIEQKVRSHVNVIVIKEKTFLIS
jgi:hypothetical protein